jgi:hypothetical protein
MGRAGPPAAALEPDVDRLPLRPGRRRGLGLGHPSRSDPEQSPPPRRLLRRPAEAAEIPRLHARGMPAPPPMSGIPAAD